MYQLITTKGRKSADGLADLAAWLLEMQPSFTRIVHGGIEAEVEWMDDTCENDLRWELRMEEAAALDLAVNNGNIYLAYSVYLRHDVDCITLVDNRSMVSRELRDFESLAKVAAAVEREVARESVRD